MEIISKLFDIHKLPFKIILWVTIVSGLLLFPPALLLEKLKLTSLIKGQEPIIGLVFLASFSLVSINIVIWLFKQASLIFNKLKRNHNLVNLIQDLDISEKAILREFYIQGKRTILLPVENPTVVGLSNEGIIQRTGNLGQNDLEGMLFPFQLHKNASKHLTNVLIQLPNRNDITDDEKTFLLNSRPDFIKKIEERKNLFNW